VIVIALVKQLIALGSASYYSHCVTRAINPKYLGCPSYYSHRLPWRHLNI